MIPFGDEDRLLLIPGPTPVHQRILNALARPTISHTSAQLAQVFTYCVEQLKVIADNKSGRIFVLSGSGTLAQETAILNFVTPHDRLLVASNGFFATRMHEIANQHDLDSRLRTSEAGTAIPPDELDAAIAANSATVVAFTHVETSTGVMAPLPEYMRVIRSHNAMAIVDGVAAFAGVPEPMANLEIDVLLTGAQKALGVPPGLSIVGASKRAWEKRTARTDKIPGYYPDLARWAPIMEHPERYFSTHPVNMIYALAEGLRIVEEEGLEARYNRHRRLSQSFREGLAALDFRAFTDPTFLAPTLSAVRTPHAVRSSDLRQALHTNGVVAAAGVGFDTEDQMIRFGHMGNISEAEIATALDAIRYSL